MEEGIPDIIAWKDQTLKKLREKRFIQYGATLADLTLLRALGKKDKIKHESIGNPETIVIEVKDSKIHPGNAIKQLYIRGSSKPGYLKTGYFDKGFGMVANRRGITDERAGILSFDKNGFYVYDGYIQKDWDLRPIKSISTPQKKYF